MRSGAPSPSPSAEHRSLLITAKGGSAPVKRARTPPLNVRHAPWVRCLLTLKTIFGLSMLLESPLSHFTKPRPPLLAWSTALLFFGAGLGIRLALAPWLEPVQFLTFHPAVALTALVCGWRQAAAVLIASALAAWYFFFEPAFSFAVNDAQTIWALIGFLAVGALLIFLITSLRTLVESLKQANSRLEAAKIVQEDLFRELQHRVANNFQLVCVLLSAARRKLTDPAAVETLAEAEERIMAMSKLHRLMHQPEAFDRGLEPVVREVLKQAFSDFPVELVLRMPNESRLSFDQMTAITLLVNEAALNAAKHVFSKERGTLFRGYFGENERARVRVDHTRRWSGDLLSERGGCEKVIVGDGDNARFRTATRGIATARVRRRHRALRAV